MLGIEAGVPSAFVFLNTTSSNEEIFAKERSLTILTEAGISIRFNFFRFLARNSYDLFQWNNDRSKIVIL